MSICFIFFDNFAPIDDCRRHINEECCNKFSRLNTVGFGSRDSSCILHEVQWCVYFKQCGNYYNSNGDFLKMIPSLLCQDVKLLTNLYRGKRNISSMQFFVPLITFRS